MEAINFLSDWIKYLFLIVPVGAGTMVTYQAIRKSISLDEGTIDEANRLIGQTIKGSIIILSISGFIEIVKTFFL